MNAQDVKTIQQLVQPGQSFDCRGMEAIVVSVSPDSNTIILALDGDFLNCVYDEKSTDNLDSVGLDAVYRISGRGMGADSYSDIILVSVDRGIHYQA